MLLLFLIGPAAWLGVAGIPGAGLLTLAVDLRRDGWEAEGFRVAGGGRGGGGGGGGGMGGGGNSASVAAIGSGGAYALSAARALIGHTELDAMNIVDQALAIAADGSAKW